MLSRHQHLIANIFCKIPIKQPPSSWETVLPKLTDLDYESYQRKPSTQGSVRRQIMHNTIHIVASDVNAPFTLRKVCQQNVSMFDYFDEKTTQLAEWCFLRQKVLKRQKQQLPRSNTLIRTGVPTHNPSFQLSTSYPDTSLRIKFLFIVALTCTVLATNLHSCN